LEPEDPHPEDYTLAEIYDSDEFRGKVGVSYNYDFGDNWHHAISFLGREDPTLRKAMKVKKSMEVVCLAGEVCITSPLREKRGADLSLTRLQGHPCAEDCGGVDCWEDLKAAFKKKGDPDQRKHWYKTICTNGDPKGLDPYKWNIVRVKNSLAKIKGSRPSGREAK
jgi:hypothetical protein